MMVALFAVLVAPRGLRPLVALLGTGLAIGVSYSILVLGWHFPATSSAASSSPAATTSLTLGGALVGRGSMARTTARRAVGRVAAGAGDLLAPAAILALSPGAAIGLVAMRGHILAAYSASHLSFVAGAVTIAGLAGVLATAMAFALRR